MSVANYWESRLRETERAFDNVKAERDALAAKLADVLKGESFEVAQANDRIRELEAVLLWTWSMIDPTAGPAFQNAYVKAKNVLVPNAEMTTTETSPNPCWCNAGCMLKLRGELPASRYCKQAQTLNTLNRAVEQGNKK